MAWFSRQKYVDFTDQIETIVKRLDYLEDEIELITKSSADDYYHLSENFKKETIAIRKELKHVESVARDSKVEKRKYRKKSEQ